MGEESQTWWSLAGEVATCWVQAGVGENLIPQLCCAHPQRLGSEAEQPFCWVHTVKLPVYIWHRSIPPAPAPAPSLSNILITWREDSPGPEGEGHRNPGKDWAQDAHLQSFRMAPCIRTGPSADWRGMWVPGLSVTSPQVWHEWGK